MKQSAGVLGRLSSDLIGRDSLDLGDPLGDESHIRRMVLLPAVRFWREEGRVCLDEHFFKGNAPHNIIILVGKGDDAGKRDKKIEVEIALRVGNRSRKAVQYPVFFGRMRVA